jgi:hypothetical protein
MIVRKTLLVALLLVSSAPVLAQAPSAPPAAAAPKPVVRTELVKQLDASFARIDTNRDGTITRAEADASQERARQLNVAQLQQRAEQQFRQLDTDKNGQISLVEFKARANAAQVASGESAIALLDSNKDKQLTIHEFRAKRLAQFDASDINRDGMVTHAEMSGRR